ncbi:MAG TPA: nucleotide exchange factor GrpE [Candidatus Thermoplasmatota archaeon]|nr:nucleotide exchange factor GrpE [Candidatus Thermoplasmatota archaeon]
MTEDAPTQQAAPEAGTPEPASVPLKDDLAAAEVERLRAELKAAETRAEEMKERLLRMQADFDNTRKRLRREQEESRKFAAESLIKNLLDVLANFDRATADTSASAESLREGLTLIARQFRGVLEKEGVSPIEAVGKPFDPAVHEAILREPTADQAEGTVVREFERGYTLHGKVIRPAKVSVAAPPS